VGDVVDDADAAMVAAALEDVVEAAAALNMEAAARLQLN
jgi:hypothetical protein